MNSNEFKDLTISAIVLAVAFSIAWNGGVVGLANIFSTNFIYLILFSFFTVSLGFIFHELGHRYTARKFGAFAEYKLWPQGLALAILLSLGGFVFAALGAVVIHPKVDLWGRVSRISKRENGIISIMGPVTNIILGILFLALTFIYPSEFFSFGVMINSWLAIFNLIPFGPLDGMKVFIWDKRIWVITLAVAVIMNLI